MAVNRQLGCSMCYFFKQQIESLSKQLEAANLREQRQSEQIDKLLTQTSLVITSKFETVNFTGPKPENSMGPSLPLSALSDVETFDDEKFVAAMSKVAEEIETK